MQLGVGYRKPHPTRQHIIAFGCAWVDFSRLWNLSLPLIPLREVPRGEHFPTRAARVIPLQSNSPPHGVQRNLRLPPPEQAPLLPLPPPGSGAAEGPSSR